MRTRAAWLTCAALVLGLVTTGLGACSSPAPTSGPGDPSPAARLAAAKAKLDSATSVHLTLASRDVPADVTGLASADGWGAHPPAFKGTFQLRVKGTPAGAEVIAVDGKVYAKLPFVGVFAQVDPRTLGVPDPARLFDPGAGLTSLLAATSDPVAGAQTRKGSEVLTTIGGALGGKSIADMFGVGDPNGRYAVTYGLTDPGGELRTVELTGPFFSGATSTYSVTLDRYGEPVDIRAP